MGLKTILMWIMGIVGLAILYKVGVAYPAETVIGLSILAILIIALILFSWGKNE